jgi:predicted DNA-binding WGR domain protein
MDMNFVAYTPSSMQNGQMPLSNVAYTTELVKKAPEKNQERFYRMTICLDLFGEVSLMREYGRLGQRGGQLKLKSFPDEDAARKDFDRLLKQKLRHGYVVVAGPGGLRGGKPGQP